MSEQESFISHLVELRQRLVRALAAVLRGVRRAVPLAGLGLHLRLARRAAHERAARGRQDDRHRRDHAVHGAGEGHGAGGVPDRAARTCSTRRGPSSRRACTSTRRSSRCRWSSAARCCSSLGVAFCYYFVFGKVFTFIHDFAPKSITPAPDIEAYFSFVHHDVPRLRRHLRDPDRGHRCWCASAW